MSRSISSIPTSELSNLNFVDLDEQEMITLTGGDGSLVSAPINVNAENALKEGVDVNAKNALREGILTQGINIG